MPTRSTQGNDPLAVLGIDATSGRPLSPLPKAEARRWAEQALRRPRPPRYGVATGDLASAGWGVVFTEGVDAAARDALGPLLDRRRRQAGDLYRELTYQNGEGATDFRNRLRAGLGRVDPRQVPWYLLLVGDPAELPHGFEHDLDVPHAVGRLTFEDLDDLEAYARRVAKAEERPRRRDVRGAVFSPAHDSEPQTDLCGKHLGRPIAGLLERRTAHSTAVIGKEASRSALLGLIDDEPDVLFIVSHGLVFPRDHPYQRKRQGAVVCADWPGPKIWPKAIPKEQTLAAEDLPVGALESGMAVLFGCHTAGTPRRDPYDNESLDKARELTSRPFVSALARRLLGREGGALAVLGHVGRAYTASILWRGARQASTFEDLMEAVLDGRRLGEALDGFGQRYADLAIAWIRSRIDPDASESSDPLDLWVAFHDARSWSLIGDPALRLPAASAV